MNFVDEKKKKKSDYRLDFKIKFVAIICTNKLIKKKKEEDIFTSRFMARLFQIKKNGFSFIFLKIDFFFKFNQKQ